MLEKTNEPFIIAIDGTAASGKGTLARMLAEKLNFSYLDTGKLYRYVGYIVIKNNGNPENEHDALLATNMINNQDIVENLKLKELESDECGNAASKVATFDSVRNELKTFQKNFANSVPSGKKGAILDGRDIGTVICPQANLKLYIDAKVEIRAKRRHKELQSKGISVKYDAVLANMLERDKRDANRQAAPMKAADDALFIDTSFSSIDDAFKEAYSAYLERSKVF